MFSEHCKQVMNITARMFELKMKQRTSLNIKLSKKQKWYFIRISEWGGKLREMSVGWTKKADSKAPYYNYTQFL